ncbi:hypothetical protein HK097_003768 [Rhizophlyctis rosea]|uniref:Uncharacterized protein n=1 Tax=Rhizophlyctis rosea TaxID=64517 RepID=A0AAD5S202_9FUNG|nr:hypothetical protein HK097_003768 [Rhizophlyctis rosea]
MIVDDTDNGQKLHNVQELENSPWLFPVDTIKPLSHDDHQTSLSYGEIDEADAREIDNNARSLATSILQKANLPQLHAPDSGSYETANLLTLAKGLEIALCQSSAFWGASVLAYVPYNVLRALLKFLFDVTDIEDYLSKLSNGATIKPLLGTKFPHLRKQLNNADILHQSLLRSTRSLIRDFPSPHSQTQQILPSFPIYDSKTGRASPLFRRRNLSEHEKLHPIFSTSPDTTDDVPIGSCSIAGTLTQFKRAFKVFTMNLLSNTSLHRSRAIVTGGSITACLLPWPQNIREAFMEETRVKWLFDRGLGLPVEIGLQIAEHSQLVKEAVNRTDTLLFEWLHGETSEWQSSDIDIFFVVDPKEDVQTSDEALVKDAAERLVDMHKTICTNRTNAQPLVESLLDKRSHKWYNGFDKYVLDDSEDFFGCTHHLVEKLNKTPDEVWRDYDWVEDSETHQAANYFDPNERGWSEARRQGLKGRLRFAATVRTNNSITVTGVFPVRHTQLMLPVVRAAEEVVLPFDLDCVAVYWDGENVWASQ